MWQHYDHALDLVDAYLHEALPPDGHEWVEQHCDRCPVCKVALDEARKRLAALATVPASEAPEALLQATMELIDVHDKRLQRRRRLLIWGVGPAVAAAVLVLASLHVYYARLKPTPYDLVVLGQNQLFSGAPASLRIRLIDNNTGLALANVPVEVALVRTAGAAVQQLASFITDADGTGTPRFQLPDWDAGAYQLRIVARPSGTEEVLTQSITLKHSWKLMLSSDKPLYQPGQTIRLRALALRQPDLRPVAGQEATFSVTDPKGNVIFKRKDVTSKFGIVAADCALADEIIEGHYGITCKLGDSESRLTVEVKKYVLPKFKVEVAGLQPYYQPGEKVRGAVHARYFFGKPVAGGEVKLMLRSNAAPADAKDERILRTDDDGKAEFEIALPEKLFGRGADQGDARFLLEVAVTDRAGQKHGTSLTKLVTQRPLRFEVIPEGGSLVAGVANRVYLYASYADGTPAAVAVNVTGIEKELRTSVLGVTSFEITPKGATSLTIKAEDAEGRSVRETVNLAVGEVSQDFLFRTDKAVYDGGQSVHLIVLGGGAEPVFVDFIKDGQTALTQTVALNNGRGELHFDLPPDLFGTIEVNAYRFPPRPNGSELVLPVRKTRVLYVRPAQQVRIAATLDRTEYRPGQHAKVKFALTDAQGKPAPGALSLAAVDEALFALLDQRPGMEQAFYTLEQELLKPVVSIYPWSPEFPGRVPAQDRVELEQALFARTAQALTDNPILSRRRNLRGRLLEPLPDSRRMSAYTLATSSFPLKVRPVADARERCLVWVWRGWWTLIGLVLLTGYVALWLSISRTAMTMLHLLAVGLLTVGCCELTGFIGLIRPEMASMVSLDAPPRDTAPSGAVRAHSIMIDDKSRINLEPQPVLGFSTDPNNPATRSQAPIRVRDWFPEMLLWRPQLITDDRGETTLDVALADSITEWRLSASAVTADGRLGGMQAPLRVFQPFFVDLDLPVALTRGDEVELRAVVHNYHKERGEEGKALPQTVTLTLAAADWFASLEPAATKTVELGPNEQKLVTYRIRVTKVGKHTLAVKAEGSAGLGDALQREIEVVPDGRRVEQVVNGTLQKPADLTLRVPDNAIEGSPKAILKIYPSNFSQLVEGLENIFQMPHGCFEQTSSTTYPNVLALDYLRRTGKTVPAVEAKAKQYIHLGYQRLLGFEVQGGGFDWFGRAPANRVLTAYGLMEFADMAKVHDVDPNLIARTRNWLLQQRTGEGIWEPEHMLNDGLAGSVQRGKDLRLATTAYIAWAVFAGQPRADGSLTRAYLLRHRPESISDPYVLALVCNALLALDPASATPYLERLDSLKTVENDKLIFWKQAERTAFYGAGASGNIETTALAVLALLPSGNYPASCRGGLAWLASQKDGRGTWHSTQATVLALKALLAGTGAPQGDRERRIEITLGQGKKRTVIIPPDQGDVMQQLDLSAELVAGDNRLSVAELTDSGAGYQVAFRYYVPDAVAAPAEEKLAIRLDYDKTELAVDETLRATVAVKNRVTQTAPMVMLELPVPAGFTVDADELAELVRQKAIARYQLGGGRATLYLLGLDAGQSLELKYTLRAQRPVKVTAPAARVYEYYDPANQGTTAPVRLTVNPR